MKDEIKEILDNFKNYEERYKKCNENQFIIFYRDIHLLLDYITNLQEEKKQLKDGWQQEVYDKDKILNDWLDLKVRNKKAIEYIKETIEENLDWEIYRENVLLNILQGEDKE